jgi:hypothetical protein
VAVHRLAVPESHERKIPAMSVLQLLFGAILLSFGRTLYWLFVGLAGFLAGMEIASSLLVQESNGLVLLWAILAGVIGALLSIFLQRATFALGGLLAGGYLAIVVGQSLNADTHAVSWMWFAIGAVIGCIAALYLMDWAIIGLSSLAGAAAIVDALRLGAPSAMAVLLMLAVTGVLIQGRSLFASHETSRFRGV